MKKLILLSLSFAFASALPIQNAPLSYDSRTGLMVDNAWFGTGRSMRIGNGAKFRFDTGAQFEGDAQAFRNAIGIPSSSFDGTYASLTSKPTLGTASALNVPAITAANAASTEVVRGDDPRLSDNRLPPSTAVTPGNYGDTTHIPILTIGQDGRVTAAGVAVVAAPGTGDASTNTVVSVDGEGVEFNSTTGKLFRRSTKTGIIWENTGLRGTVTVSSPLSFSGGTISIPAATNSVDGYLPAADRAIFNAKQPAGNYITGLTGDVVATGPGSIAATIAANAVTLAKFQQVATGTLLGRNTAGTGNIEVLNTIPTATMPALTGDVTNTAGSLGMTIASNAVTNAKAAQMATKTYKGRTSAGTGNPEDVPVATLKGDLSFVKGDVGLGNVDNTADTAKPVSTAQQTALDGKAAKLTFAALGSTALSLNPTSTSDVIYTATWTGTPVTLTYTGGSDTAGERQRLLVNVTSSTVLTVTPTSSTVYRNGSTTALGAGTVTFPVGRYWITFLTPDTGTNLYMEDTVATAADLPTADAGGYFGTDNVEASLQQLGAAAIVTPLRARVAKTATYALLVTDKGNLFDSTSGTWSYTFGSAASAYGAGWHAWFMNSGSGTVTIDPNGSENIRTPGATATTLALTQGEAVLLVCDGTNYFIAARSVTAGSSGIADPGSNGLLARTSSGTATPRTITDASGTYTTTTDGNGVTGNPTIALTTRVKNAVDYVTFVLTIDAVADSMNYTIGYVSAAFTITELRFVHNGTLTTPSIVPTIRYGTDRSATGTAVVTSPSAVTSATTGASVTSFDNFTPAANSWIWITTASKSGTTDRFTVIVVGHY